MTMKMQSLDNERSINEAMELVKDDLAVPYLRYYGHTGITNIGYCVLNRINEVGSKYMNKDLSSDAEIVISPRLDGKPISIHIGVTNDDFLRFWSTNTNVYLVWEYDIKTNIVKLIARRKKS